MTALQSQLQQVQLERTTLTSKLQASQAEITSLQHARQWYQQQLALAQEARVRLQGEMAHIQVQCRKLPSGLWDMLPLHCKGVMASKIPEATTRGSHISARRMVVKGVYGSRCHGYVFV